MKICVLLVTYNRKNDLTKALDYYDKQVKKMSSIIVVDNASTDGTCDFLNDWKNTAASYEKIVVKSPENTGGSGGFYLGMKESLKLDYDFLFLADDDAFPDKEMILKIDEFYNHSNLLNISGICTSVINQGKIDEMHRRKVKKGLFDIKQEYIDEREYKKAYFEVDEFSFVGALISKDVIEKIGLPNKDYFIYYDDTEYSTRVRRTGKIYCVPQAKMYHDTILSNDTSWKDYYVLRNSLDIRKKYYGKKCFYYYMIVQYLKKCTVLSKIFKHRTLAQRKMFKKAINDAIHDHIKKDDVYHPGANIELL